MALTFKVSVVWEIKSFDVHFLANSIIDLDEIWDAATICWFVEAWVKPILHK